MFTAEALWESFVPLPLNEREPLMAAIYAHFDESGKFKDQAVVSFCGVIGNLSQVVSFDKEWRSFLHRQRLQHLTMKDALKFNTPLSKSKPALGVEKRSSVLRSFADIITAHFEIGLGAAVDVRAHQAPSNKKARRILGEDPHYTAFLRVLLELLEFADEDDKISLVCDDEQTTALPCYEYYRRVKSTWPTATKKLVNICFADDKAVTSLQAADMLSSLVRLEAKRRFNGSAYDFQSVFDALVTPRPGKQRMESTIGFWGTNELARLAEGYERLEP